MEPEKISFVKRYRFIISIISALVVWGISYFYLSHLTNLANYGEGIAVGMILMFLPIPVFFFGLILYLILTHID